MGEEHREREKGRVEEENFRQITKYFDTIE